MRCPSYLFVLSLTFSCRPFTRRRTSPQTTPTLARSRQNSTTSSTASLRWRRCSAVTSPCFVVRVTKSGKCFHFPYHGLPTLSLTLTTLTPALSNTSFRHQGSEQPKRRGIRASVVGLNEEDKWPLPWVPLTFCVVYLPPSIFVCPHSFVSP